MPLDDVLAATARIAHAVDLPVMADIVSSYGATSDAVAETVRAVIATGAVGINIADGLHASGPSRAIDDAVARTAADQVGMPIVVNARIDIYLRLFGHIPALRLDEMVRRGRAYFAAGADCLDPIGLADAATLAALVRALDAPVNLTARPSLPDMTELARLGVARVSTATRLATLALLAVDKTLRQLRASGRFDRLE